MKRHYRDSGPAFNDLHPHALGTTSRLSSRRLILVRGPPDSITGSSSHDRSTAVRFTTINRSIRTPAKHYTGASRRWLSSPSDRPATSSTPGGWLVFAEGTPSPLSLCLPLSLSFSVFLCFHLQTQTRVQVWMCVVYVRVPNSSGGREIFGPPPPPPTTQPARGRRERRSNGKWSSVRFSSAQVGSASARSYAILTGSARGGPLMQEQIRSYHRVVISRCPSIRCTVSFFSFRTGPTQRALPHTHTKRAGTGSVLRGRFVSFGYFFRVRGGS